MTWDEKITHPALRMAIVDPPLAEDDFYCLRYQLPYNSFDCAIRTEFETHQGCQRCEQGRFNQKRHRRALRAVRFPEEVSSLR